MEYAEKRLGTTYVHGCNRLELLDFKGLQVCKYINNQKSNLQEISGVQEKLKI